MSEELKIIQNEDGTFLEYDDTFDITIHCHSEEEQNEVLAKLNTPQSCGDCISREAVMHILDEIGGDFDSPREAVVPIDYIADMVSELPPVTPQQKKSDERAVLDKIRAEIEHLTYYCCEIHPRYVIDDVLQIIDKYKAEGSEE